MKHYYKVGFLLFCCFFAIKLSAQKNEVSIQGTVKDENNKPLQFVTLKLVDFDRSTYSDEDGKFSFIVSLPSPKSLTISLGMVGKAKIDTVILSKNYFLPINITLNSLNLSLNEVQVSAVRKNTGLSNSSVLFDRQAIEQIQAFSLTDILNNLPGKTYSALDLQGAKNITLRSDATGNSGLNNSLGTAIIIDGLVQSNNANMQNLSLSKYGTGSTIDDGRNGRSYDVTFGGIDLREIPADNIESVEVISGVAPAQYGDLTDGAVIINRQAGASGYQFNTRFNGGSTNFSLSKGFKLGGKLGALNTNVNYLLSNDDPRDMLKKYQRISGGLMWTTNFNKFIKNTLSADFSEKLDDGKEDPDDDRHRMTYSKNRRFSLSNRFSAEINGSVLKRINFSIGGDMASTESYTQYWLNGAQKASAVKDTTGVYEGFFTDGMFMAVDHVVGRPINLNGNLNFLNQLRTGSIVHSLSLGVSLSLSSNKGQGVLSDPDRQRWPGLYNQSERPYNFELVPNLVNTGLYVEDKFSVDIFAKPLKISAGIRLDEQNGYGSFQPRINTNYNLTKDFSLNLAYGIATKAPTMAYRYPSPTYFDIILLNYYTGNANTDLLLVYTEKIIPDYSNLKPSKSEQFEFGFSLNKKMFNTSLFGYVKKNRNGFNSQERFYPLQVPVYRLIPRDGQKPLYEVTGESRTVVGLKSATVDNGVRSENYGIEWFLSSKKINAIQTSFSLNSALNYSDYWNSGSTIRQAADKDITEGRTAWYGIYETIGHRNWSLTSRVNSDTHIPKLGFVISVYADFIWEKYLKTFDASRYPIGYLDKNSEYHEIENFDPQNSDYGHLAKLAGSPDGEGKLPFSYANVSLRLSKEIKKKIRFSINAYNVFNIQPSFFNNLTDRRITYNDATSVGAEVSIKF